ncbi:unnamed protein product [Durusdinium trenchii]|uniref:Uncharacterized protein n=1 Tax=Durusdinium trenchii TaxID=1381693 RepID=A0ABP0QZG2_9DINO
MSSLESPGVESSGYSPSETSWHVKSHQDYEAPRRSVYGNQYAEPEGRDRMYKSSLPFDSGPKVGPLDRSPMGAPVLAPSSKSSVLAELGTGNATNPEDNHRRGRSDMKSHLRSDWCPKTTQVLEEKMEASWVKRPTVKAAPKAGWSKVSPPKQEKVSGATDLRTLHRASLDREPDAALRRKPPVPPVPAAQSAGAGGGAGVAAAGPEQAQQVGSA